MASQHQERDQLGLSEAHHLAPEVPRSSLFSSELHQEAVRHLVEVEDQGMTWNRPETCDPTASVEALHPFFLYDAFEDRGKGLAPKARIGPWGSQATASRSRRVSGRFFCFFKCFLGVLESFYGGLMVVMWGIYSGLNKWVDFLQAKKQVQIGR